MLRQKTSVLCSKRSAHNPEQVYYRETLNRHSKINFFPSNITIVHVYQASVLPDLIGPC